MLVVPAMALFGIVRGNTSAPPCRGLLLFLGGAFNLANIVQEFRSPIGWPAIWCP
jgi:hypothetical protein